MSSQRKYVCSFCSKAFSRSEHKTRHENSHRGFKPFQCKICNHSFVRRDLVQRHIKAVHKGLLLAYQRRLQQQHPDTSPSYTSVTDVTSTNINTSPNKDQSTDELIRKLIAVRSLSKDPLSPVPASEASSQNSYSASLSRLIDHISNARNYSTIASPDSLLISKEDTSMALMRSHPDVQSRTIGTRDGSFAKDTRSDSLRLPPYIQPTSQTSVQEQERQHFMRGISFLSGKNMLTRTLFRGIKLKSEDTCDLLLNRFFPKSLTNVTNPMHLVGMAIICLGDFLHYGSIDTNIWTICLSQSLEHNDLDNCKLLSLTLLVYTVLNTESIPAEILPDVFAIYQRVLSQTLVQGAYKPLKESSYDSMTLDPYDIWCIFNIWVLLIRRTGSFDSLSSIIFNWFLNQGHILREHSDVSLSHLLSTKAAVLSGELRPDAVNILSGALYCEFSSFARGMACQNPVSELHNIVLNINSQYTYIADNSCTDNMGDLDGMNNNGSIWVSNSGGFLSASKRCLIFQDWKATTLLNGVPTKFSEILKRYCILPISDSHWLLWGCTWMDFLKNLSPANKSLLSRPIFLSIDLGHNINLNNLVFDETLYMCSLPIIAYTENVLAHPEHFELRANYIDTVVDIFAFQVKLFGVDLPYIAQESSLEFLRFLKSPILQLFLWVWYSIIYRAKQSDYSISASELSAVNYFMERYVVGNSAEELLEKEIVLIAMDPTSIPNIGYRYLINGIVRHIRDNIIDPIFMTSHYLDRITKFKLVEFLKKCFDTTRKSDKEGSIETCLSSPTTSTETPRLTGLSRVMTSPILHSGCSQGSSSMGRRRASIVSVGEDGKKLLLPPLNFIPSPTSEKLPSMESLHRLLSG